MIKQIVDTLKLKLISINNGFLTEKRQKKYDKRRSKLDNQNDKYKVYI